MSGTRDAEQDPLSDPLIGRTLDGRYSLEARIGRGGMGYVYRGLHLMMQQRVAVKVLRPDLEHDETAAKRFAREARGAFRLDHPSCVRVLDFGYDVDTNLVYLVMEYLDGRTVGDELYIDGPMSSRRAAHVMGQVAGVLERAHGLGLVHRDLKPDNIMLLRRDGDPDFAKVLDFGLAKLYEPDSAGTTMFSLAALTQEGTVFGTPEYMSPEQATGRELDPRSDIYAAGVVLYEMLTGQLPFDGGNFMAILSKHVREAPVPPAERRPELGIDPRLDELVMRCLAKKPEQRPQSARELAAELGEITTRAARRPSRVPAEVASSQTVDLSRSRIQAADTAGVSAVAMSAQDLPAEHASRPGSRRGLWLGFAALALVGGGIAVAVAASGGSGARSEAPGEPAARPVEGTAVDAGAVVAHAATVDATPAPAPPDAGSPDAAKRRPRPRSDSRRENVRSHLRAAAAARKAGNRLKEIAELDAVLKLDQNNREAAYRLGVALLRAGDTSRGCAYLRRAGSHSHAQREARRAGCGD